MLSNLALRAGFAQALNFFESNPSGHLGIALRISAKSISEPRRSLRYTKRVKLGRIIFLRVPVLTGTSSSHPIAPQLLRQVVHNFIESFCVHRCLVYNFRGSLWVRKSNLPDRFWNAFSLKNALGGVHWSIASTWWLTRF